MEIKKGQNIAFNRRVKFGVPAILKKNRKNLVVKEGVVGEVLGVDEVDKIANVHIISNGIAYTLWAVPLKSLDASDKKGEISARDSAGTWFFGRIHKDPSETIHIEASASKRLKGETRITERQPILPSRGRSPRITPKTPRLRR